jgi:hypothetical protein
MGRLLPKSRLRFLEHIKEHRHAEASKRIDTHGNSITGGVNPRRTFRTVETNVQTKRTVARIVPISASNAAFLSVMVGG